MPMIVEGMTAMLAYSRIGALHSVVFGGFSPEALAGRLIDCASRFIITADEGRRAGERVPLNANVDEAAAHRGADVEAVLVIAHAGANIAMQDGRNHWFRAAAHDTRCPGEPMAAEDLRSIPYTSGSTDKPEGVLHTTGGCGAWTATTFRSMFDCQPDEIY